MADDDTKTGTSEGDPGTPGTPPATPAGASPAPPIEAPPAPPVAETAAEKRARVKREKAETEAAAKAAADAEKAEAKGEQIGPAYAVVWPQFSHLVLEGDEPPANREVKDGHVILLAGDQLSAKTVQELEHLRLMASTGALRAVTTT